MNPNIYLLFFLVPLIHGAEDSPKPMIISSILGLESCAIFTDNRDEGMEFVKKFNCNIRESRSPEGVKQEANIFPGHISEMNCINPNYKLTKDMDKPYDAMPTTFNYPVLGSTLNRDGSDFMVVLSDGTKTAPICAFLAPADENNEGHTAALIGEFGGREAGTWPKSIEIVSDTLMLSDFGNNMTPFKAKGAKLEWSKKAWKRGDVQYGASLGYNSPEVMLHSWGYKFSTVGEDMHSGFLNHCRVRFPETTHVVKILFNGGPSKDGFHSLLPSDIDMFTIWKADQLKKPSKKNQVCVTDENGVNPCLLGLADLGYTDASDQSFVEYPDTYKSDNDNYVDLCFKVDEATWDTIGAVQIKAAKVYAPRGEADNPEHLVAVDKSMNYPYDLKQQRLWQIMIHILVRRIIGICLLVCIISCCIGCGVYRYKKHQKLKAELGGFEQQKSEEPQIEMNIKNNQEEV